MEEVVIVGLFYFLELKGVESRVRDYIFVIVDSWKLEIGFVVEYLLFIRWDVLIFIEFIYWVDVNWWIFIGYLLGGLFGGYVFM